MIGFFLFLQIARRIFVLLADRITTPLGDTISISSRSQLHPLKFVDRKALKSGIAELIGRP